MLNIYIIEIEIGISIIITFTWDLDKNCPKAPANCK